MEILQSILEVSRRILWFPISYYNTKWKSKRLSIISKTLTQQDGKTITPRILESQTYIEGGIYHWSNTNNISPKLDLVFHEVPLAIIITERYYGKWNEVWKYAPSKKVWESYMSDISGSIHACIITGFPYILIDPNDPIDYLTLSLRIDKLLGEES